MPNLLEYSKLTSIALALKELRTPKFLATSQSNCPFNDTPSNLSLSQFSFHLSDIYLKSVNIDWYVPNIVAILIFFNKDSSVSSARQTTLVKLQNSLFNRLISPQGLLPTNSLDIVRLGEVILKFSRLKMPRSPVPDFINANHSSINSCWLGFSLYTAELLANERCGSFSQNAPVFALRISLSSKSDKLINAVLLTPPDTIDCP